MSVREVKIIVDDAVRLLRDANPVPVEELPDPATSARAQEVYRFVVGGRAPGRAAPVAGPRRRLAGVLAVLMSAAVGAGAVAYARSAGHVPKPLNVACYQDADLTAKTIVVARGRGSAEHACAAVWARGDFGSRAVPRLTTCVLRSGVAAVFPGDDPQALCARLNLRTTGPAGSVLPDPSAVVQARDAIVGQLLARSCATPEDATAVIRRELDRAGLTDWTVRPAGPFSAERPCAGVGFEGPEKAVVLVPQPPSPSAPGLRPRS